MNSILALLLIGILFLVTQGGTGGLFGGGSASGYGNRNSYDYDNYYYNEQQFYKRSGYDNGKYIIFYFSNYDEGEIIRKVSLGESRNLFNMENVPTELQNMTFTKLYIIMSLLA